MPVPLFRVTSPLSRDQAPSLAMEFSDPGNTGHVTIEAGTWIIPACSTRIHSFADMTEAIARSEFIYTSMGFVTIVLECEGSATVRLKECDMALSH